MLKIKITDGELRQCIREPNLFVQKIPNSFNMLKRKLIQFVTPKQSDAPQQWSELCNS